MPLLAGMPKTKQTTGEWTMEALIAKQKERFEHEKELDRAVAYARANEWGGRKAMTEAHKLDMFKTITWNMVHNVLSGRSKRANCQRLPWDILTESETEKLVSWIKASAINKDPANDTDVSEQVIKMLKARSVHNKLKRDGGIAHDPERCASAGSETSVTFSHVRSGCPT